MVMIVQRLIPKEDSSISCHLLETPSWEDPWHKHQEIELCMILKGSGKFFTGTHIVEFKERDIFFIGSDVPHYFKKEDEYAECSAVFLHFQRKAFGSFLDLPETSLINELTLSSSVIKLRGEAKAHVGQLLKGICRKPPMDKMLILLQSLNTIASNKRTDVWELKQAPNRKASGEDMQKVYDYLIEHFQEDIKLADLAQMTNQSISSFSKKFKQSTKRTFTSFLIEIRIRHACKLLLETDKSISEICYESGFRNWANFSNHFKKLKKMPPSEYRQKLSS